MALVDLPYTMVDLPNTMVDLPNTMVDLLNTLVLGRSTMVLGMSTMVQGRSTMAMEGLVCSRAFQKHITLSGQRQYITPPHSCHPPAPPYRGLGPSFYHIY